MTLRVGAHLLGRLLVTDRSSRHPSFLASSGVRRAVALLSIIGLPGLRRAEDVRFLIRDRDARFGAGFDEVFRTEGVEVIRTPFRSPQANAHAERFVRTARTECLDWLLILGPHQLDRVLRVYVDHYNTERSHRALGRQPPMAPQPPPPPPPQATIQRRDRLGGLLHEYHLAAA